MRTVDGKGSLALSNFLGYAKDEDGKLEVNHEQTKVIQLIFGEFIAELPCHANAENIDGHQAASQEKQVELDHGVLHPNVRVMPFSRRHTPRISD